ncbi:serine/arginine repetitive matrix-like protein [Rhynchospora pubera]|uniref:Serine/arginine repetitive matrix-like protein n=1 Tax=Rhynchospora pubera TaxID=906938 RepID=A0AAV8C904_9POAL|nr:serine/arginine repetitive matrix-like protein [Rhynchospora pubera]KAJ4794911.1 serine/arginine repetitive matrix-like protein [Rhynchospora pubera]
MAKEETEEETTVSPRLSSSSSTSSHEFSFWPSSTSLSIPTSIPDLSTAEDLFSNGILLPTLSPSPLPEPNKEEVQTEVHSQPVPVPESEPDTPIPNPASIFATSSSSPPSSSKRWREIFKLGEKDKDKDKEKPVRSEETKSRQRKDKKPGSNPTGSVSSADISINIWPFGRSRSAGTAGSSRKPTGVPPVRKSSSAPCSRSNSRGESGKAGSVGRRWAASPGRTGVPVGRSSPIWQIKRNGVGVNKPVEPVKVASGSARVINFSVNSCIGYGMREGRCGGESKDRVTGGERHGGLFGINYKGLFSKKAVH